MSNTDLFSNGSGPDWTFLYSLLRIVVTRTVYKLRIPLWYGQEADLVEDIVQETLLKLLERMRKAELGEAEPIKRPEHIVTVIARNFCLDLRRHDRRSVRFTGAPDDSESYTADTLLYASSFSDEAVERVYQGTLFTLLAQEIMCFPEKQRTVLLIDLANGMCFEKEATPLQRAFQAVGVDLQDYQRTIPAASKERSQHTASLYCAYKRFQKLESIKTFTS